MTRALLDVNVLIALFDADHTEHRRASDWLDTEISSGWASCAISQNGFVRILSQPRYPSPVSPSEAVALLGAACRGDQHEFWSCDLSLLEGTIIDASRLHSPRQVTDAYLLSLAVQHEGRFVTFDRAVPLSAVPRAEQDHLLVL